MNAETNKIKDIYLEVLKPVVDKLYNMKVFYSREVARVLFSDTFSSLISPVLNVKDALDNYLPFYTLATCLISICKHLLAYRSPTKFVQVISLQIDPC